VTIAVVYGLVTVERTALGEGRKERGLKDGEGTGGEVKYG